MPFDDVGQIKTLVRDKESELSLLRQRMQDDFDLYTMEDYEPKDLTGKARKGYASYTTSAPRNIHDKITDGMNRADFSLQVRLPDDSKEADRKAASQGELFLFGGLNAVDRRLVAMGEPPFRESMGWYIATRGWCAARGLVFLPEGEREVVFDFQPWDPMQVTWEQGHRGLLWAARKFTATKAMIEKEWGIIIKGKQAEVIDFWDEETNSVIIGGGMRQAGQFGKPPTEHNIGHVPVLIVPVGSMPSVQDNLFKTTVEFQGDSVWAASRKLYGPFNKYVSRLMDIADAGLVGSLVFESEDGTKTIEGDPYANFQVIPLKVGEKLGRLDMPGAPPETAAIVEVINNDVQKSDLPFPIAFGATQHELSGRALSILGENTRSVFSPRTSALVRVYTWAAEEMLGQFKRKGMKSVKVSGFRGFSPESDFFSAVVKPKEIDPMWFVQIKIEPRMPRDQESEIAMSLAATQRRGPDQEQLVSVRTAREDFMRLRDPDAEEERVLVEKGKNLPPIIAADIARALVNSNRPDLAELVLRLLSPEQAAPIEGEAGAGLQPEGPAALAPPGGGGGQEVPPEIAILMAVLGVLEEAGAQELANALTSALQAGGVEAVPPDLVQSIIEVLGEMSPDAIQPFLQVLGLAPQPAATPQGGANVAPGPQVGL